MRRNLLLSGGVAHPFARTSRQVADLLAQEGVRSTVTDDLEAGLRSLEDDPPDLVTVNALRWRMDVERYAHLREGEALSLSEHARGSMDRYVRGGGRLLALHTATICFDDWPGWGELVGARWDWERSSHPPLDTIEVEVVGDHPIVAGIGDFQIVDEAYGFLEEQSGLAPLLRSSHGGRAHPLLWARRVGGGRVVYDALGHDERSFAHPVHREILQRAVRWLFSDVPSQGPPQHEAAGRT